VPAARSAIPARFIALALAIGTVRAKQAGHFLPIAVGCAARIADHWPPRHGMRLAGNVPRGKA
jgi:hypothetical protein